MVAVGRYLLVPPLIHGTERDGAPVSQWHHMFSSDTAKECDAMQDYMVHRHLGINCGNDQICVEHNIAWVDSRCIASDDPRLKQ
jgi:hypothetical protein